jgi:hypothetical protein
MRCAAMANAIKTATPMKASQVKALRTALEKRLHSYLNRPKGVFAQLRFDGATPKSSRMIQ